ncbi:MAG: hypothetical protein P8125_09615 [Gemmatimonadota bacterium]
MVAAIRDYEAVGAKRLEPPFYGRITLIEVKAEDVPIIDWFLRLFL